MVFTVNKLVAGLLVFLVLVAGIVSYTLTQPKNSTHIIISGVLLTVELAKTSETQQKGLSDRAALQPDHGMLFVFDHEDYWGFWMIQMRFSLDIIWFNANHQVVFIEQDLQPCSPEYCPVYTPSTRAIYVLEVNAGFVAMHNVLLGTTFSFVNA